MPLIFYYEHPNLMFLI